MLANNRNRIQVLLRSTESGYSVLVLCYFTVRASGSPFSFFNSQRRWFDLLYWFWVGGVVSCFPIVRRFKKHNPKSPWGWMVATRQNVESISIMCCNELLWMVGVWLHECAVNSLESLLKPFLSLKWNCGILFNDRIFLRTFAQNSSSACFHSKISSKNIVKLCSLSSSVLILKWVGASHQKGCNCEGKSKRRDATN